MNRRLIRLAARRWQQWVRLVVWPFGSRLDATKRFSSPSVVNGWSGLRAATVDHIVDPDGSGMRVIRVAGCTSHRTVDDIDAITGPLPPHCSVHLDLIDAEIDSISVMREFERLVDQLERALTHVRVVGVDPNHPALHRRR